MTQNPMKLTSTYYGEGTLEEWFVWKKKLLEALDGQSISIGLQMYTFIERLSTGDAKATFNQADLDIGICTIDYFNKVLAGIYTYPSHIFRQ